MTNLYPNTTHITAESEIDSKYFRPYVNWLITHLKKVMLLNEWKIYLRFDADSHEASNESNSVAAEISVCVTYLDATITVFREAEATFRRGEVETTFATVVHELSHILTQPFWDELSDIKNSHTEDYLRKMWEQQTQRIANIIVQMLLYESAEWLNYKAPYDAQQSERKRKK